MERSQGGDGALGIAPRCRSARATAPSASAPTISRRGGVTDHRINLTLYKLDRVMMGELDEIIEALIADHQSKLLAEIGRMADGRHARRACCEPAANMLAAHGIDDPALDPGSSSSISPARRAATRSPAPRRPIEAEWPHRIRRRFDRRSAGEPVHRILGFRAFYGLRPARSRRKRWSRGRTPKRWSSRAALRARVAAARRPLPHSRSRHRHRRDRAGAAPEVSEATADRRRHLAEALWRPPRANAGLTGLATASRRSSPTGSTKFPALPCNCLKPALYTDKRALRRLQREVRDIDPLRRPGRRRGWARCLSRRLHGRPRILEADGRDRRGDRPRPEGRTLPACSRGRFRSGGRRQRSWRQ